MSPAELILAIDQGTSSTKAVLVDQRGLVVARGQHPLGQAHPKPGWVEQSAHELWDSVVGAVAACVAGRPGASILGVGISNQRESLVLWERATGEPLAPIISWQDQRTTDQCAQLVAAGHAESVRQLSGLPLDPMFSATKGSWLLDAVDPDRRRSRNGELCLGTVDSWLLSRFGDDHLVEVGNAARTQLLNLSALEWDPDLLALFRIPREVLPRIVASTGPFPSARGLPIKDGTPVAAVLGDSHAALYAHAGWNAGTVKATYGTGSSVMSLCGPGDIGGGLCRTVAWQEESTAYAVEGNIRSSGATLNWLAGVTGRTPPELAELAATTSSDGVILVPGFNGLAAPWWDDRARAELSGMTLGTGLAQLARAALESVALQVEDVVAAVETAVGRVAVLQADGGASGNDVLMQIQADVSGRDVRQAAAADLSALGAAHLSGRTIGLWTRAQLEALERPSRTFHTGTTPAERAAAQALWHRAVQAARTAR